MRRRPTKRFGNKFKRFNIIISIIANYGIRMKARGFLGTTSLIVRDNTGLCGTVNEKYNAISWLAAPSSNWHSFWPKLVQLVNGVSRGYSLKLVLYAIVFKADLPRRWRAKRAGYLNLKIGFRHLVVCRAPKYSTVQAYNRRNISIVGLDQVELRNFGIRVRSLAWPDVYKGKGIQYKGETLTFKPGKQR